MEITPNPFPTQVRSTFRKQAVGNRPSDLLQASKVRPVSETQAQKAQKPTGAPLRLSRQVGLLLSTAEIFGLSEWQKRRLRTLTKQLSPEGVLAASRYANYLRANLETYQSLWSWVVYLSRPHRGLGEYSKKPKRRMGVGYRDKGSKPDASKRSRDEANNLTWIYEADLPESWWRSYGMIPLYFIREGEWLLPPMPS